MKQNQPDCILILLTEKIKQLKSKLGKGLYTENDEREGVVTIDLTEMVEVISSTVHCPLLNNEHPHDQLCDYHMTNNMTNHVTIT